MIIEESKELEGLGAYEVVGPNGEYYGRYAERPSADKVPLYAMVMEVEGLGEVRPELLEISDFVVGDILELTIPNRILKTRYTVSSFTQGPGLVPAINLLADSGSYLSIQGRWASDVEVELSKETGYSDIRVLRPPEVRVRLMAALIENKANETYKKNDYWFLTLGGEERSKAFLANIAGYEPTTRKDFKSLEPGMRLWSDGRELSDVALGKTYAPIIFEIKDVAADGTIHTVMLDTMDPQRKLEGQVGKDFYFKPEELGRGSWAALEKIVGTKSLRLAPLSIGGDLILKIGIPLVVAAGVLGLLYFLKRK